MSYGMSGFRHRYVQRTCVRCGYVIEAPVSRVRWVHYMHDERCSTSTEEEQRIFRRTGRWPKRQQPQGGNDA